MIRLADQGDADREDVGCGVLYGVLRDSAFKILQLAEAEKRRHQAKGWWEQACTPAAGGPGARSDGDLFIHQSKEGGNVLTALKGSQTEKNLLLSFAGESQARNRYTYFAGQARKDGFVQIADVFEETANHEKEHAKRFFMFLKGSDLEITGAFPAGVIGSTVENLKAAAAGEHHEQAELYPGFAGIAREEGFDAIAAVWLAVAVAEKQHEKRYRELAANIQNGMVFKRPQAVVWRCRNCGYLHEGPQAPEMCPACAHPQAHFELLGENW
jgi:rubrerythrin